MTREKRDLIVPKKSASESALRLDIVYRSILQNDKLAYIHLARMEANPSYSSLRKWAREQARDTFILVTIQTAARETRHIIWFCVRHDAGEDSRPVKLDNVTGIQGYKDRLRYQCPKFKHQPAQFILSSRKGAM